GEIEQLTGSRHGLVSPAEETEESRRHDASQRLRVHVLARSEQGRRRRASRGQTAARPLGEASGRGPCEPAVGRAPPCLPDWKPQEGSLLSYLLPHRG